jgi:hypothetical protein
MSNITREILFSFCQLATGTDLVIQQELVLF